MRNLFRNIWEAPGSTIAGAIAASIGVITASGAEVPGWVVIGLSAVSAFLAVFSGNAGGAE